MLGQQLHNTISRGRDGRILERELQVLFASAALSVLPKTYKVCPDVGPVGARLAYDLQPVISGKHFYSVPEPSVR